jgi:hypothetical protein
LAGTGLSSRPVCPIPENDELVYNDKLAEGDAVTILVGAISVILAV